MRAGKVATIHDSPVAYAGGTFVGYTIIDPVTGAGAYKIGGGENGGILILVGLLAILTVFLMIPVILTLVAGTGGAAIVLAPIIIQAMIALFASGIAFITAGFLSLAGYTKLCSKVLGAAIGALTVVLGRLVPVLGTIIAGALLGGVLSDVTSICG